MKRKVQRPKAEAGKCLSPDKILDVLKAAREHSTRDWCLLLLCFRHAIRSSEVRELKITDLSLTDGTIRIERAKRSVSPVQTLDAHKAEPVLDEFVALRVWLKERREDGSGILFPSQKGGVMSRKQLLRILKKYAAAVGVPGDCRTLSFFAIQFAAFWPNSTQTFTSLGSEPGTSRIR